MNATEHPAVLAMAPPNVYYPSTRSSAPWRINHLAAVTDHCQGEARPTERAILDLLEAVEYLVSSGDPADSDQQRGVAFCLEGAIALLDTNIGRLDPGTLHRWIMDMAGRMQVDLDRGPVQKEAQAWPASR